MDGEYMTIPVNIPSVVHILNTDVSPERQLIAAVIRQAMDDIATYPARHVTVSKDPRTKDRLRRLEERRHDAEQFFLTDRCLRWLPHITPDDREPEQIRQMIIEAEIERRQRRQSAMDGTRQWTHEADRLRAVPVTA